MKKNQGQATIEFALTLGFVLGFIFFFIQMTAVMGLSSYIQYASFMGSRALLSAGPNRQDQVDRAQRTVVRMLKQSTGQMGGPDRWGFLAKGHNRTVEGQDGVDGLLIGKGPDFLKNSDGNSDFSWQEGVRYSFRSGVFLKWIKRLSGSPGDNDFVLTSESWLLREPSFEECKRDLDQLKGGSAGDSVGVPVVLYDNGC